jgi:hypothetical protein
MKHFVVVVLLALCVIAVCPVSAEITDKTAYVTTWTGATPITNALAAKTQPADVLLKSYTDTAFKDQKYPLQIETVSRTTVTIDKFRCEVKPNICGYWITADRDGKQVAVNNPIWLFNAPYSVVVSEIYDEKADKVTVTIKEDLFASVRNILQGYAERQPVGKPTVGTL